MKARYYVEWRHSLPVGWTRWSRETSLKRAVWGVRWVRATYGCNGFAWRIRYRGRVVARWKNGKRVTR